MFESELFPDESNTAATDAAAANETSSDESIRARSKQKHRAATIIAAVIYGLLVLVAVLLGPTVAARLNAPAVNPTGVRVSAHGPP